MNIEIRDTDSLTPTEYESCLTLMKPERRQRLSHLPPEKRRETVLGEWMAKNALAALAGLSVREITLLRDTRGKPYAKDLAFHFSISHAAGKVVCAVADSPIGVDIEKIRPTHPGLADRICTESDAAALAAAEDRQCFLISLWTAKEAYFKWKGSGITDLKSVSLCDIADRLIQQSVEGEYILSVVK